MVTRTRRRELTLAATALGSAPSDLAEVASGVNQTVARVGGLVAVAVVGLIVTLVFDRSTAAADHTPFDPNATGGALRRASESAFRAGMALSAVLAFAGAVTAATAISDARD